MHVPSGDPICRCPYCLSKAQLLRDLSEGQLEEIMQCIPCVAVTFNPATGKEPLDET